jgi:RsiW-degrading membrane proteinase PrsW (M82 family)
MSTGASIALGVIAPIVGLYALLLRWAARFQPPSVFAFVGAFAWGAGLATWASLGSVALAERLLTAARWVSPGMLEPVHDVVLAPTLEELAKGGGLVLLLVLSRRWLEVGDGPSHGLVLGGTVGLGFTLVEDVLVALGAFSSEGLAGVKGVALLRTVILGLGHATYTGLTGLGVGVAMERRLPHVGRVLWPIAGLAAAMSTHALRNVLAAREQLVALVVYSWVLIAAFGVLLALSVGRARRILQRQLSPEVGGLLAADELEALTSYLSLDRRLFRALFRGYLRSYLARSARQRSLAALAFVKHRRRYAPRDEALDEAERALRSELHAPHARRVKLTVTTAPDDP